MRHILLKQFYMITLDINTIKHPCINPCTFRNRNKFERGSVDFKTISVPFTCARSNALAGTSALYRLGVRFLPGISAPIHVVFLSYFLNHFIFHVMKGNKNGCPCIVEIRALRVVPWLRPCTCLRLVQGLRPRHSPGCLWSPQCTGNHS